MNAAGTGTDIVIVNGKRFFSFFVDGSGASWTSRRWFARKFNSFPDAQKTMDEIRQREKLKRKQRLSGTEEK